MRTVVECRYRKTGKTKELLSETEEVEILIYTYMGPEV